MATPQLAPIDNWVFHLGKLLSSFQSLEFVLRAFLFERTATAAQRPPRGHDVYQEPVGVLVLLNPMTDQRSLGQLIRAYNSSLPQGKKQWRVDDGVVTIRDALAHGRVTAPDVGEAMRLIKFARPDAKGATHVRVSDNFVADLDWLKAEIRRTRAELLKVVEAHETLH